MVIAITERHTLYARGFGGQHITARVTDKQRLGGRDIGHFYHEEQRRRVGFLLRQRIATDDPAEVTANLHVIQQRRDKTLRFVGDQRHFHALLVQPLERVAYAGRSEERRVGKECRSRS